MDTEFRHWEEWKEECDLRVCGEETRAALLAYAGKRLCAMVVWAMKSLHSAYQDIQEIDSWVGWDLFENYYIDRGERTGKSYKDWLFLTAQNSRDDRVVVLEKETYLLLRNIVRTYIRDHYPPRQSRSLDAPVRRGDTDGATLHDLVPHSDDATRQDVEARDALRVAGPFAERFFGDMGRRDRVALAVLGLGLPLSCREAEEAAGCKKSMLSDARHQICDLMLDRLRREFPEDVDLLRFCVVDALVGKCIEWARGEVCCEPIFRLVAQRQAGGCRR